MDHDKKIYTKSIIIHAPLYMVWRALTEPELMQQWMGSTEMKLQITTDWQPGSEFVISGYLPKAFENRGKVLRYEKESRLAYSHLSSLSDLPEDAASYTVIEFILSAGEAGTGLELMIKNFPTEVIFKHMEFYWQTTIIELKGFVESM